MFPSEGEGEVVKEKSPAVEGHCWQKKGKNQGDGAATSLTGPGLATTSYLVLKEKCPTESSKELGHRPWQKPL